jgi:hypothetical protein
MFVASTVAYHRDRLQRLTKPQHFRSKQLTQAVLVANELPVIRQGSIQFLG